MFKLLFELVLQVTWLFCRCGLWAAAMCAGIIEPNSRTLEVSLLYGLVLFSFSSILVSLV